MAVVESIHWLQILLLIVQFQCTITQGEFMFMYTEKKITETKFWQGLNVHTSFFLRAIESVFCQTKQFNISRCYATIDINSGYTYEVHRSRKSN